MIGVFADVHDTGIVNTGFEGAKRFNLGVA